jgi:hypothetical protein
MIVSAKRRLKTELNMNIQVEVSPGELFDKITILEIKIERISDAGKLSNLKKEYAILSKVCQDKIQPSEELDMLVSELKSLNENLWTVEDDIRDCERRKDFGDEFIELARTIYRTNDRRATTKRKINELLNSDIFEEKSYQEY